ncbi:MAG: sulfatase [Gammaproteobacteria bacterium]|jgi:arylsulfatase A-like enzyme
MNPGFARLLMSLTAGCIVFTACGGSDGEPTVIRLQDEFANATVTGAVAAEDIAPTLLRFDDDAAPAASVLLGVENLRVEGGALVGTTTGEYPIVRITRSEGLDNPDLLHSIEVRARVSVGANLAVLFDSADEQNAQALSIQGGLIPWSLSTPLVPGDELQTYSMTVGTSFNTHASDQELNGYGMRQILLRPSDVAGAEFEIESVRLIYRREYLATVPSGVSWQGFDHRSRETVVTRAPERVTYDLTLPSQPWLDLAIGTAEQLPVTFRVSAEQSGEVVLAEARTLTTAARWEPMSVELAALAGQNVRLSLELESEQPGAVGYWGAPAIRNDGALPTAAPDAPQGVILFVADTLRRDHLTPYGYERDTTPTLARLAAEGALMLDNQANSTWTKVSVPSFHSSTYPRTNKVQQMLDRLPAAATTLAEAYREAGYATLGLSANSFVGTGTNLHQGFEDFEEAAALIEATGETPSKSARVQVDRLLPWLEGHRDVPFFVNIHVTDPHSPFLPQPPYDTYWGDADTRRRFDEAVTQLRRIVPDFSGVGAPARGEPTTVSMQAAGIEPMDIVQHHIDLYDGSVRAMDAELGRIVETLERLGLRDRVLLVFIADHGEEFLEHGGHFHRQVYGENSNVPLVLWAPGRIAPGTVVGETVQSLDLMPTMLELSGLPVPATAQGQSFVSLLEPEQLAGGNVAYAQTWSPTPVFSERMRESPGGVPGDTRFFSYSVIDAGWKLVHHVYIDEGLDLPEYQLFDHVNDPLDQIDLAQENPAVVESLTQLLQDWMAYADAAELAGDGEATEGLDPAELQRLCSLGYIAC